MKQCRNCKQEKPTTEFYKHSQTADKLRSECKSCWRELSKTYHLNNLERQRQRHRVNHFKRHYGLTIEDVETLKEEQNHSCMICEEITELVVDHNHTTGKVRDLLCGKCNQGLGLFRDNSNFLKSAIRYLEKHS